VIGSFNNWDEATALELTGAELIHTGTTTVTTSATQIEYMVVAGQTFGWAHKPLKEDNTEYGFGENINHVLVDGVNTVEYTVYAWKDLTEAPVEETYTLTFNVTVPEGTEGEVFVVGSFTNWLDEPSTPLKLTKNTDGTYSGTVEYTTVTSTVEYKYLNAKDLASLNYEYEELISANRVLTLTTPTATDIVEAWKAGGYKAEVVPEMVDVLVRLTSIPSTTETFPIRLIGSMTGWKVADALTFELVGEVYEVTLTIDKNVENKFCLYLDKEQAEWHQHQAADEFGVALADHVITAEEYTALLVEIAVPNWKGLTPEATEETYTLTFNVTVPEGTEGEVFVVGSFTNWLDEPSTPLKLTKNTDGTYSGTVEYTTVTSTVEYKYLNAKDLASLNYEYEELISANRVLTLTTPTATDTVEAWKAGGYKAEAPEVTYTLNFTVSVPADFTGDVYVLGEFNNWNLETALLLTKGETTYTGTTTYTTNKTTMEYKYFNHPAWAYAEGNEANAHIGNRIVELVETLALTDTILGWEKVYVEPAPGVEYTLNFSFNINVYIPEGYKVYLIGDFNDWNETTPVELVGEAGLYTYQTTYTTDKTKLDYMIVTGETFGWAHKTLKPDNTEYGSMENIVHDLVAGENAISYIVPGWAGITPPTPPAEYTLTFTVTVPEGTEGNVYVAGSFTNWTNPESTPLQLTKGEGNTYTGSTTITTQETSVEYKYVNSNDLVTNYYEVREHNRVLELATPTATDEVTAWIDGGYHAPAPEVTYTLNFTVSVPADFTGDVYVAGSFTNWLEEGSTPLKLTKNADGKYVGSTTFTTTETTIIYKYFNHTEYTYVEGTVDGGFVDNREVILTETTNIIDVVAGWEAVYVEPTP
jgi:hypothetical protein